MAKKAKGKSTTLYVIDRPDLQRLFDILIERGYDVIGPTVRDQVIVYDSISSVLDLPVGKTDRTEGGLYRLSEGQPQKLFNYNVGPQSWKKFLFPPAVRMWQAYRENGGFVIEPEAHEPRRLAFIGVRACELSAIAVQDRVFMGGSYADPIYQRQRENVFIVAVNCGKANATCFCSSMNTGPKATAGFDLALTEVMEAEQHYFVVEVGSDEGEAVLEAVPHRPAAEAEATAAAQIMAETAARMGRSMDTTDIKTLLTSNYDHPRWDQVASRCLMCGNCTQVCPTCFCTTVEDVTDLSGNRAERRRLWDSCFSMDFSYIVGGSIRASGKSRYRQWMVHKLATWIDQFGTSGCVGCGRCIAWCPVGIDITEEASAIRAQNLAEKVPPIEKKRKK